MPPITRLRKNLFVARLSFLAGLAGLLALTAGASTSVGAEPDNPARRTLLLNDAWEVAEGGLETRPAAFDHTVPVPGIIDLAQPAFTSVGLPVPLRQAFWYRRTFTVDGAVPATARIRLRKTMFGARVYLNGELAGEHWPCFTPGEFDVARLLKGEGAENELVVRIGATPDLLPPTVPNGFDGEKKRYSPGIYDSVELILAGAPDLENIQAAPDPARGVVRAHAALRNRGTSETLVTPVYLVREKKSGLARGQQTGQPIRVAAGGEAQADAEIKLEAPHPWSPDDPFLYELEISLIGPQSGPQGVSDRETATFGLRDFHFDTHTGRAQLNGQTCFPRGTNVCLFRFLEDPKSAALAWDEAWVRRLHREFKRMHWDSIRYCIGFPPELWYRIADEEGLMIQDEFPIWGLRPEVTTEELAREFGEWIPERANHPCVVIWDASNETLAPQIAPAVEQARGLDLSARPWENSINGPGHPGDPWEAHPYRESPAFHLCELATMNPWPDSGINPKHFTQPASIILNEYGAMWTDRAGNAQPSCADFFRAHLGPNATGPDRLRLYAIYESELSEFWRAGRQAAAVLHFCGLTYDLPGYVTGDPLADLSAPRFNPEFSERVGDAFAPVGLMIEAWPEDYMTPSPIGLPTGAPAGPRAGLKPNRDPNLLTVVLTNDLPREWRGEVRLRLLRGEQVTREAAQPCAVTASGQARVAFPIAWPGETGNYRLEATLTPGADSPSVRSRREFRVYDAAEKIRMDGLAWGKSVAASSAYNGNTIAGPMPYAARYAVDGDPGTRWSSEFSDPQWLSVDLGQTHQVRQVEIDWEGAYGKAYTIEVSTDGQAWREVYRTENGPGGNEVIKFPPTPARWVRLSGTKRATAFGYSLWEFRVRGDDAL